MPLKRKQVQLTGAEKKKLAEYAAYEGVSESSVAREWVESFIERGTDYVAPTYERLQILLPPETLTAALERCVRDGVSLQDVIQHEIAELDKL